MPIRLMALEKSAQPAASDDTMLRTAIVNVAYYFLRMAESKTPAEMEQIIWQQDSVDGVDHGESCAAFASLTLELGAQVVGQQSWVTGGTSYPWPLYKWADVRVEPNPASLGITSILQDAQANHRWHPLGDGYQPMPGDWVLFEGHVEVVTKSAGGKLDTIGGDSGPNLSVNSHVFADPLSSQGVVGFVNNGGLSPNPAPLSAGKQSAGNPAPGPAAPGQAAAGQTPRGQAARGQAAAGQTPRGQAAQGPAAQGPAASGPAASGPAVPARAGPDRGVPDQAATDGGTTGLAAIPGAPPGMTTMPPGSPADAATPAVSIPGIAPEPGPASPGRWPGSAGRPVPRRHQPRRVHAARRFRQPDLANVGQENGADVPGTGPSWSLAESPRATPGADAVIPGLPIAARGHAAPPKPAAPQRTKPALKPVPAQKPASAQSPAFTPPVASEAQQAFIDQILPGAVAAQRNYGVPASITIAQAIEESGWGQSELASRDHNLFGIKGTGPAGSDLLPTQEFENGQMVNRTSIFRVYHDFAESIDDHGRLLATSGYYRQSMAVRMDPDKFAQSLTGVYATDPEYGAKLIGLMRQFDLYRYDAALPASAAGEAGSGVAAIPGLPHAALAPGSPGSRPAPPVRVPHHDHHAQYRHPTRPRRALSATMPSPTTQPGRRTPPPPVRSSSAQQSPSRSATPAPGAAHARPRSAAAPLVQLVSDIHLPQSAGRPRRGPQSRVTALRAGHYHHLPLAVSNAFLATARGSIKYAEPLYRDVASHSGLPWELLAACDWMQCEARPRYSPVHGEKLGTVNSDGTIYHTKSEALEQCAEDLIDLANAVYQIDVTSQSFLSVRDLANVFAAFRWGGLLKLHRTSAMEFPYSVAGLTEQHINMRWPNIDDPNTPDRPGSRFHRPFGAVPVMLGLNYPASA
jgi:flagellum-specific peptidoglycan hydrolase FlgJ